MDKDGVKGVPVAEGFRYPAGTLPRAGHARGARVRLRHVSDCYRIVMLRFPSDVMTLIAAGHYCPPKPRRTEPQSDDRSIGGQGRRGRER